MNVIVIVIPVAIVSIILILTLIFIILRKKKSLLPVSTSTSSPTTTASARSQRPSASPNDGSPSVPLSMRLRNAIGDFMVYGPGGTAAYMASGRATDGGMVQVNRSTILTNINAPRTAAANEARSNVRPGQTRRRLSQRSVRTLPIYREGVDDSELVLVKAENGEDQGYDSDEGDNHGSPNERAHLSLAPHSAEQDISSSHVAVAATEETNFISLAGAAVSVPSVVINEATTVSNLNSIVRAHARRESSASSVTSEGGFVRMGEGWGEAPGYEVASFEHLPLEENERGASPYGQNQQPAPSQLEDGTTEPAVSSTSATVSLERARSGLSRFFTMRTSSPRPNLTSPASQSPATLLTSVTVSLPSDTLHVHGRDASHPPIALSNTTTTARQGRHRANSSLSTLNFPFGASSSTSNLLGPSTSRVSSNSSSTMHHPSLSQQISTSQISLPITSSLVKIGYEPPRAGLTAEQLQFLSSTESVNKFGIGRPFGEASIRRSIDERRGSSDERRLSNNGVSGSEEVLPPSFDAEPAPAEFVPLPPSRSGTVTSTVGGDYGRHDTDEEDV